MTTSSKGGNEERVRQHKLNRIEWHSDTAVEDECMITECEVGNFFNVRIEILPLHWYEKRGRKETHLYSTCLRQNNLFI